MSVEVQKYDKTTSKYISIIEVEGVKKQIVILYNQETGTVKPVSETVIPEVVETGYSKETVTESGQIVYSSNNVTKLETKFTDIKFVLEESIKLVPDLDV